MFYVDETRRDGEATRRDGEATRGDANQPNGYKRGMRQLLLVLALSAAIPLQTAWAAAATPPVAGRFEALPGDTGVLVAAPHGGYDLHSDDVARQVALATGAGYLLASGFRTFAHPWNVNRPTAGAGRSPDQEDRTPEAAGVYAAYARLVKAQAPRLYVEIHGNARPESAGWIEAATVNIPAPLAAAFQADFRSRVAALDATYPRYDLKIEPFDDIHYRATGAKQHGIFRHVPRGLHLELPKAMRLDPRVRSRYAWTIAQCVEGLAKRLEDAPPAP
jgi:hypothetical protein